MPHKWVWISAEVAWAAHAEQLAEHGGGEGVRDDGLLESAMARPHNLADYGEPDAAALAAAYAFGIARNHPFVDGNKRAALLSLVTFLGLSGIDFVAAEAEAVVMIRDLAAGVVDETGLFRADTVLAKHDETYMPKEVVDALKAQGVWQEGETGAAN